MSHPAVFGGIDVAQATLASVVPLTAETWQVANAGVGSTTTVLQLQAVAPTLVVAEATGGRPLVRVGESSCAGGDPRTVGEQRGHR
jgi:hypothetical protein